MSSVPFDLPLLPRSPSCYLVGHHSMLNRHHHQLLGEFFSYIINYEINEAKHSNPDIPHGLPNHFRNLFRNPLHHLVIRTPIHDWQSGECSSCSNFRNENEVNPNHPARLVCSWKSHWSNRLWFWVWLIGLTLELLGGPIDYLSSNPGCSAFCGCPTLLWSFKTFYLSSSVGS